MQEIKRAELSRVYGIELPIGLYDIVIEDDTYVISTVKDHTSGCILVGENKVKGMVINSTQYEVELVKRIGEAIQRAESIFIDIE